MLFDIRLTPKAPFDAVTGLYGDGDDVRLAVSVRAIPDKGAANAAAALTLARWLGVAKSDVVLVAGAKSRLKTMALTGDPISLQDRLSQLVAAFVPGDT